MAETGDGADESAAIGVVAGEPTDIGNELEEILAEMVVVVVVRYLGGDSPACLIYGESDVIF